jgi:hypothetical protein
MTTLKRCFSTLTSKEGNRLAMGMVTARQGNLSLSCTSLNTSAIDSLDKAFMVSGGTYHNSHISLPRMSNFNILLWQCCTQVHRAMATMPGFNLAGYKCGATNELAQQKMGITTPFRAPLPKSSCKCSHHRPHLSHIAMNC